jgi:hypothetical protein
MWEWVIRLGSWVITDRDCRRVFRQETHGNDDLGVSGDGGEEGLRCGEDHSGDVIFGKSSIDVALANNALLRDRRKIV